MDDDVFFFTEFEDLILCVLNKTNQFVKMSTVKLTYTPTFSNNSKGFLIKCKDRKHYPKWLLQKIFQVAKVSLSQPGKPATLSLHNSFLRLS